MGSTPSDISEHHAFDTETPQHNVMIAQRFAIGKYEVTFAEWDACFQDSGCRGYRPSDEGWGRANMPVMNVSWDDAKLYVRWLSQKTGKIYRLPSEAEWEYAARAGSSTKFYFGNDSKSLCKYANVADEAASQKVRGPTGFNTWQICNDGHFHTAPVGSFVPNKFGLYDMLGNVGEWVEDVWHPNYNGAPSDGSAWLTGGDSQTRIARGGSYYNLEDGVRSAVRLNYRAGSQGNLAGFRVARTMVLRPP
jgi:formylglycine-generating enzyme required for sulfatase activity